MAKKYVVKQAFTDKVSGKVYQVGDKYPANVKKERLAELLGEKHDNHKGSVIEEISE